MIIAITKENESLIKYVCSSLEKDVQVMNGIANIKKFGKLQFEIEKIELLESLPTNWTYPLIQPKMIEEFLKREKN